MTRGGIIVIIVVVAALFGVVFLTSGNQPAENAPADRFQVPAPGGAKDVPVERQNPG